MAAGNDHADKFNLALDLIRQKHAFQSRANQAIETKTGIVIGFVSVLAANLVIVIKDKGSLIGLNIFTLGLVGLTIALILLVFASSTRTYFDSPDFDAFYSEEALAKTTDEIKNQVIADMKKAYEENLKQDTLKGRLYDWAIRTLAFSVVLLILGVIEG